MELDDEFEVGEDNLAVFYFVQPPVTPNDLTEPNVFRIQRKCINSQGCLTLSTIKQHFPLKRTGNSLPSSGLKRLLTNIFEQTRSPYISFLINVMYRSFSLEIQEDS